MEISEDLTNEMGSFNSENVKNYILRKYFKMDASSISSNIIANLQMKWIAKITIQA